MALFGGTEYLWEKSTLLNLDDGRNYSTILVLTEKPTTS